MIADPQTTRVGFFNLADGFQIHPPAWNDVAKQFLDANLIALLVRMHREFESERQRLLRQRKERQAEYDRGALPAFECTHTAALEPGWRVASIPPELQTRRVEITGPVNNPKMVINMLSRTAEGHRADTAMLDFEDSMKPTWSNVMNGVSNLVSAVHLSLDHRESGKHYRLDPSDTAVVMTRVRGLHLNESNIRIDRHPMSAGLFDLVTTFYHTAATLLDQGKTPIYYIPKTEHYLEARWWNALFTAVQEAMGIPAGTLRATFLIETLPAAFQMEEILFEFKNHAAGLNVGRWDKIFSDIKILREHPDRVLADRGSIHLDRPWMMNYAKRLIKICHRRGAYAIGGMSAFTPGRTPEDRAAQTAKVKSDKLLEASMGHDGCWVSHPYFIGHAMSAFTRDHQLDVRLEDFPLQPDLIPKPDGPKTMAGLRKNVRVGIAYMKGWNEGIGCVAWDGLMEDLATLEISRTQVWQWLRHGVTMDDGLRCTADLVRTTFDEELQRIEQELQSNTAVPRDRMELELNLFRRARIDAEKEFLRREFKDYLAVDSELEN
jgi:malate synthase